MSIFNNPFSISLNSPEDMATVIPHINQEANRRGLTIIPRYPEHYLYPTNLYIDMSVPSYTHFERSFTNCTVSQFLDLKNTKPPLSNEQILVQFLKHHRKFSSFKRQVTFSGGSHTTKVKYAIDYFIYWTSTKEGYDYWQDLHGKWIKVCEQFSLTGIIDYTKLESIR